MWFLLDDWVKGEGRRAQPAILIDDALANPPADLRARMLSMSGVAASNATRVISTLVENETQSS
jgi:hypothetical protein